MAIYSGGYNANGIALDRSSLPNIGEIDTSPENIQKILKVSKGVDCVYQRYTLYQDTDGYIKAFKITGSTTNAYTFIDLASEGSIARGIGISNGRVYALKISVNNNTLVTMETDITNNMPQFTVESVKAVAAYYARYGTGLAVSDGNAVYWYVWSYHNDDVVNNLNNVGTVALSDVVQIKGYGESSSEAVLLMLTESGFLYGAKRNKYGSGYLFDCPSSWSNDYVPYVILSNVVEYDLAFEAAVAITSNSDCYIWGANSNYIKTAQTSGYMVTNIGSGYAHCAVCRGTYNAQYPVCWLTDTDGVIYSSGAGTDGTLLDGGSTDKPNINPQPIEGYDVQFGDIVGGSACFIYTANLGRSLRIYDNLGRVEICRVDYTSTNGIKQFNLSNGTLPGTIIATLEDDTVLISGIGYYALRGSEWLGLGTEVGTRDVVYQKGAQYQVSINTNTDLYLVNTEEADNYIKVHNSEGDVITVIGYSGDPDAISVSDNTPTTIAVEAEKEGMGQFVASPEYKIEGLATTPGGAVVYPAGSTTQVQTPGDMEVWVVLSDERITDGDMSVTFYNFTDPDIKIRKALTVWGLPVTGVLRDPCDVENPTIEFVLNNKPTFNYAYINSFDRFYFVTRKVAVSDKLWAITFESDPGTTWKDIVLNTPMLLSRCSDSAHWNKFIVDNENIVKKNHVITMENFVTEELNQNHTTHFDPIPEVDSEAQAQLQQIFVLHVFNNAVDQHLVPLLNEQKYFSIYGAPQGSFYILNWNQMKALAKAFSDGNFSSNDMAAIFGSDDFTKYIISLRVYPFNITSALAFTNNLVVHVEALQEYKIGKKAVSSNVTGFDVTDPWIKPYYYDFPVVNSYEDCNPYTMYKVYVPYCGIAELDPVRVSGKRVHTKYIIDFVSGNCKCQLVHTLNNLQEEILYQINGRIGFDILFTTTNMEKANQQAIGKTIDAGLTVLGTIAGAVASGGSAAMLGGALGKTLGGIASSVIDSPAANVGTLPAGDLTDFLLPQTPYVIKYKDSFAYPLNDNSAATLKYNASKGRPSTDVMLLKNMSGYVEIDTTSDLPTPARATASELTKLKIALTNGVII